MTDTITLATLADFLINIGAGWFIAAYGVLFLTEQNIFIKLGLLTADLLLAILCIELAIWLRRRMKK